MKFVSVVAVVLAFSTVSFADDQPEGGARSAVEQYIAAALAGKVDDAIQLAVKGTMTKDEVEEFKTLVDAKVVKLPTMFVGAAKGQAIAVSEEVKITEANPDGRDKGHLVFTLVKLGDKWLVNDIDFDTKEKAKDKVERFKTTHADASELPAE